MIDFNGQSVRAIYFSSAIYSSPYPQVIPKVMISPNRQSLTNSFTNNVSPTAQMRRALHQTCYYASHLFLVGLIAVTLTFPALIVLAPAALARPTYHPVIPANGAPQLGGNLTGYDWQKASLDSRIAYCASALAAFRGSAAQSYIISHNVQSLAPEGLCRRMDQFYSLEENLETRLGQAAALAPLLFADIDIDLQISPENPTTPTGE